MRRKYGFRQSRSFIKILCVRKRHELVQIFEPCLVLREQDDMIGRIFFVIYAAIFIDAVSIIKDITLHSVYYFHIRKFFCLFRSLGKGLHYSVIRYRHRRKAPFTVYSYHILDLVESIHLAHLGMRMKLDSLSFAGVAALYEQAFFDITSHYYEHIFICIPLCFTPYSDEIPFF